MKAKKLITSAICLLLACSVTLGSGGCAVKLNAADLMEGIESNRTGPVPEVEADSAAKAADFAVRLFRQSAESGKNTLISPLSVLAALSMTANGAKGETLEQMEKVLGMNTDELNRFFLAYTDALPEGDKYKLSLANSIWFTSDERFTVVRDFLQTNADWYGADAFRAPFDGSTLKDINGWVKEKTDGMIPEILDKIPGEAVMYLVNALAFEAEWAETYKKDQVHEGEFTLEDGTKRTADFMYSSEGRYLYDGRAVGFIKYYSGQKYAFAALLPNEGITVEDYVSSLDGESLTGMLAGAQNVPVDASVPKFETGYGTEMSDVLKAMGMPAAFDDRYADFSGLGTSTDGNIYIDRVIHRTFISVGEKGTRAGAATVVEMVDEAAIEFTDTKQVHLDRPFVYMLIDTETNLPFFIGTMMDVNG
ncbi:MAG: serpin family protein [Clostridia bacterium]|nr:serpin family protein [Clostridia bacterium]